MDSAPEFLNLFVEPTGEMIYFLAAIAISQAAFLMALGQRLRGSSETAAARYSVLLAAAVIAWLGMGLGGLVALISDTPDSAILPPLERAVNALVILYTGTALLTADSTRPQRPIWRALALLSLVIVADYLFTALAWHPMADDQEFNRHALGFVWTFAPGLLLICLIGLLITVYKQTADIPLKLIYFTVLLIAYSYTTARIRSDSLDGDTSGALRLGFLAALPILGIIVYRLVIERLTAAIDEVSEYAEAVSRPQTSAAARPPEAPPAPVPAPVPVPSSARTARPLTAPYSSTSESMSLLRAIGLMLEKEDPDHIPRQIVIAIATVLRADLAVLVARDESNWADVLAAYDNIQQRLVPGLALNLEEQPSLAAAITEKMQRRLAPDRNIDELVDLYTRLDISQLGPAYIQPLMRSGQVVGVAIIGLPYTNRDLQESEITLLEGLAPVAARLLSLSRAAQRLRSDAESQAIQAIVEHAVPEVLDQTAALALRQEMQASLELAQEQIAELSDRVRNLQVELDYERSRLTQIMAGSDQALSITQRIEVLSQERRELAFERERLARALQEAQATLVSAQGGDENVYATLIDGLQRERDELQVHKTKLEHQLLEIREAGETMVPGALRDMLAELSDDKAQMAAERDQLQQELENVYGELRALGIEGGPLAVAQALSQITQERSYFKTRSEQTARERDLLLAERKNLEDKLAREAERETQLVALESDLRRLAEDREALVKQRDSTRAERDELLRAREQWLDQRTRLIGEATVVQNELADMQFKFQVAAIDRKRLSEDRTALEAERRRLTAENTALKTERDQLIARAEGNRELLQQLGADGVGTLQAMIEELSQERERLENELLQTQQDYSMLQQRLASRPPSAAASPMTQPIAPANADVVMSIAQELRTPMSSIMGYTDLLLSESVGILGALQRQFLQRVQANIDRLSQLLNDLVSITRLDSDEFTVEPVTIDMLEVIEDTITAAGSRFREKNITLHMNLADSLPPLHADHDAMHQVMMQLLSNAYLASPPQGEVSITACHQTDFVSPSADSARATSTPANVVLVSITDQGGGVPPEEQRRVFGRLYRADNPLIEGIGDTGVGLSIAKALVEAHGGTIWLESRPGYGSTFHFAVPLAPQHPPLEEALS